MKTYWIPGVVIVSLLLVAATAFVLNVGGLRSLVMGTENGSQTIEEEATAVASQDSGSPGLLAASRANLRQEEQSVRQYFDQRDRELQQRKEAIDEILRSAESLAQEYRKQQASIEELRHEVELLRKRQETLEQSQVQDAEAATLQRTASAAKDIDKQITKLVRAIEDDPRTGAKVLAGMLEQEELRPKVLAILRQLDQDTIMEVLSKLTKELPGQSSDVAELIQNMLAGTRG